MKANVTQPITSEKWQEIKAKYQPKPSNIGSRFTVWTYEEKQIFVFEVREYLWESKPWEWIFAGESRILK